MTSMVSRPSFKSKIYNGTSEKELMKAMSTYLNKAGVGDYNLPSMVGEKIAQSNKKTYPYWSFQSRTKLAWFKGRHVDFQGTSSPPVTQYSPLRDNNSFISQRFSVAKNKRFQLPSSMTRV